MAFKYYTERDTLTSSQEELLEMIENLPIPFGGPFGGISKLKDLRKKIYLSVYATDSQEMLNAWEGYMQQYNKLHGKFYWGNHARECHRHQGEIGFRRDFANLQIKRAKEPTEHFQPLLGLYSRTYKWWSGKHQPKIGLIMDNIKDYAGKNGVDEDFVLEFVFIQEMMHAYFDAFNNKGFPAIEPLEESFAEFGMLSFIDMSPTIRVMLPYAKDYVISKIGKDPHGFGFGIELFTRARDKASSLINQYKDISNWTEPLDLKSKYNNNYLDSMRNWLDQSEKNASKVYDDIIGILEIDWEKPFAPIQPSIREKWDFDQ